METGEHNYSAPPSASTSTATQTSTSFNDISCDVQTVISENSFLKQTNNSLARINLKLRKSNERLKNHNYFLKRKCHELADKVTYLNQKLQSLQTKFELSDRVTASLHECISEVPLHLYEGAAKRVQGKREKEFHPAIKRFALTLHLCSAKAYRLILISDSIISTTDLIPYLINHIICLSIKHVACFYRIITSF